MQELIKQFAVYCSFIKCKCCYWWKLDRWYGTFNPNRNTANATYTPAAGEIGTTITLTWNAPDPDGAGPCTAATDAMTITS
jgi:hypothetical protein